MTICGRSVRSAMALPRPVVEPPPSATVQSALEPAHGLDRALRHLDGRVHRRLGEDAGAERRRASLPATRAHRPAAASTGRARGGRAGASPRRPATACQSRRPRARDGHCRRSSHPSLEVRTARAPSQRLKWPRFPRSPFDHAAGDPEMSCTFPPSCCTNRAGRAHDRDARRNAAGVMPASLAKTRVRWP